MPWIDPEENFPSLMPLGVRLYPTDTFDSQPSIFHGIPVIPMGTVIAVLE
jgi:hypothetical protein